jgi:hypothetical protein
MGLLYHARFWQAGNKVACLPIGKTIDKIKGEG